MCMWHADGAGVQAGAHPVCSKEHILGTTNTAVVCQHTSSDMHASIGSAGDHD